MNKQGPNGIEWTQYTWNPVGGCKHGCRWQMPDGTTAVCYAETVAEGLARASYPQGFAHHYWHPDKLDEPLKLKDPARIFLDSMSDLMGTWVPDEQILAVLDIVRRADWHTFQLLTKNAPRLLKFKDKFPPNLWVGASLPPGTMFGKPLTLGQRVKMYCRIVDVLDELQVPVTWMSFEPLSWDVTSYYGLPLIQWAVIGAASRGRDYFQPEQQWVEHLLDELDDIGSAVFFKGNLKWTPWRAEFPAQEAKQQQMRLL